VRFKDGGDIGGRLRQARGRTACRDVTEALDGDGPLLEGVR